MTKDQNIAANSPTEIDAVEVYEQILEQEDQDRHFGAVFLDKLIKSIGHIVMWVNFILVIAIVSQEDSREENYADTRYTKCRGSCVSVLASRLCHALST
uniref:Uncharacterized protein n=1 Tax=OCS116 cluster bacterium TaxID=2030921 RepID=A0A2A4YX11_9PROT